MSVIVAKSAVCCGTTVPVTYQCFPAVSTQRIVPVGSTLTIDGVPVAGFRAAQWLVVVSNGAGTRVRSYEILATHRNGSLPTFGYRAILGDVIAQTPNVTLVGGVMNLTVTNGDVEDLIVYVTRIAIPLNNAQTNALDTVEVGRARALVRTGQAATVDFITSGTAAAATWLINAYTASGQRAGSQVFAQFLDQTVATHYGLIGDRVLTYDITITEVVGLGYELSISNTSSEDFRVSMTRIPVQTASSVDTCSTSNGLDLWIVGGVTIAAGATVAVDQAATPAHTGAKWLFGAMNTTTFGTAVCEINAEALSSTTTHSRFGLIGDALDVDVDTSTTAGGITLSVTNNESSPVLVNLLRVPTAA